MKNSVKKLIAVILAASVMTAFSSCQKNESEQTEKYADAQIITMAGSTAKLNGAEIESFDYAWHCDPSVSHDEVKNAPAEYYTGTKPETDAAAYIDSELYYFPELDESGFKKIKYDGEEEWAYYYTDSVHNDFIFATLPVLGAEVPTQMMHSESQAAQNRVLHIVKAGTYVLEGTWNGQVRIDLGEKDEVFADENAKVKIILNGADIECTAAPGIIFGNVYECDNKWEEASAHTQNVDISSAGVSVVIADDSENSVSGANVFRMLKTQYKDEDSKDSVKVQKKMRKTDGAFYSYVSMNIDGEEKGNGTLCVTSGFEGIDSELHLSVNGGSITVNSQDDGMNVNEDNVSVISFSGGKVTLNAGLGAEGDGVDSNGFIRINGGTVEVNGIKAPDNALDSEDGIYYESGTVTVDGKNQNLTAGTSVKEIGNEMMRPEQEGGNAAPPENFDIKSFKEKVAALDDDATFEDVMAILGSGRPDGTAEGTPPQSPDGNQPPEKPQGNPQDNPDFQK